MDTNQDEHSSNKRKRKAANDPIKKWAVVITGEDVNRNPGSNEVPMPTTITLAEINRDTIQRRKEISFTLSKTKEDMKKILKETFPILAGTERFYCAKSAGKVKLDFGERRCIWSGKEINKIIKGDSVLYIFCEGEQLQDSGAFSTDSEQSEAHIRLPPVGSNTGQITKMVPVTLALAPQPILPTGDLPEQISSTLVPRMENFQITSEDIDHDQIIELLASLECEANSSAQNLMDVERREEWLKQYDYEVVINPKESPLQGGAPCIFTFKPELPSDVDVKASFGNIEPIILVKTILGYICKIPASPKMTPEVIKVWLISTTTGEILAETSFEYCGVLYVRKNLGGKPGACGSGQREDGGNDGGASGGGASGGRASGGRSSGGGSSGEGAGGSGVSGGGTGGTGAGGCGSYGGGATGCQYRIEASQLGSDVVSKLCELIQKCSVGIQRQEPSATQNKACTEAEEDLEDDQLLCTQESNENYFADTEDCSSVSSETDSALSDSESWDESLSDSPLSFPWVNSRSSKSQEAILETESTQHSCEAVYSKLNVSHEIQELMTEGFTSEDSIGNNNYVGSGVCHKWNTSLPESKKTEENCEKDDHNKMQDSSQEWDFFSEGRTSHIQLASHDNTPLLCLDALDLIVENEESQYQDNELFEAPHAENAKPKDSESILSVTSNQQSATHAGPTTQSQAAQSPVSNPLWNGDSQLNMAPPQCSDEEIHSGQEWEESGEGLASWFDLCENEDAGKNEHSRWEMSSIEPNKTDGGVEKDIFDSEEDLSREQGLLSEQRNLRIRLSLPVVTPVCGFGIPHPFVYPFMMFHKDTPLSEAARNGHTDTVRLLIENGADVNKERMFGRTPLTEAVTNGHTDIVRLLVQNGANVNQEEMFGRTPLTEAVTNGHTDIVRLLVQNGANVNQEEIFGHTPLIVAVTNGHTDIVRLLIQNGADVNQEGIFGHTPLMVAVINGHTDIVRLLIQNGADVNKGRRIFGHTLLTEAVINGHTDIVRLLIQNGADVNQRGIFGRTTLMVAVINGHTDIIRLLIQNGADVNKGRRIFGHTSLPKAVTNGHTDIVRLLIQNVADVNQRGIFGHTPLIEAVTKGHTDIVRLLIQNGADVNKGRRNFKHTPLTEAVTNGHTDIVRLLIQNGADVNKGRGILWRTLLIKAVTNDHTDIARLLIQNGAVNKGGGSDLRRKFEADARDAKLSLERELNIQLRGKKIASLPKRPGKKLKTQTEMTSPRDIVEEGKCGKDRMTDVELGLNCLHLSPRCVQFKPCIMEESPGDSSIMHHYFKTINKRMDRVTLTDVGNAKQDHCVVVEKVKTHLSGDTIIVYGRKINEEGSGVGEAFRLATKDLKHTWDDEEVIAENVQIGSVVKYIQVGDKFLFQGNTKRPRWNMDKIFLDLSRADGAYRGFGDAFLNSKILAEDSYQDCTPKETSCFISLKCGVVENDRISVITELGELFNLKLNFRDAILPLSPSTLELSHEEDNKDAVDSAVVEMEEPLLISGVDGLSKPSYPVLGEGLNLRDEPKEKLVEAENPEADPVEKDDENGNAF